LGNLVTINLLDKKGYPLGVRDIAKAAGVDDTISWWTGKDGDFNVVVQSSMKNAPVQVIRTGDTINIKAYINFTGDANDKFVDPKTGKTINLTYANVAAAGIDSYWSGTFTGNQYDFGDGRNLTVNTQIYSNNANSNGLWKPAPSSQKNFLTIDIDNSNPGILGLKKLPIVGDINKHVSNTNGVMGDWSVGGNKNVTLYNNYNGGEDYSQNYYARVAGHEFGHVLGIDDAYGGGRRPAAISNTGEVEPHDFMRYEFASDSRVSTNDIEMMWQAYQDNEFQYFMDYSGHYQSSVINSYDSSPNYSDTTAHESAGYPGGFMPLP
jgi:hypothetical protein